MRKKKAHQAIFLVEKFFLLANRAYHTHGARDETPARGNDSNAPSTCRPYLPTRQGDPRDIRGPEHKYSENKKGANRPRSRSTRAGPIAPSIVSQNRSNFSYTARRATLYPNNTGLTILINDSSFFQFPIRESYAGSPSLRRIQLDRNGVLPTQRRPTAFRIGRKSNLQEL